MKEFVLGVWLGLQAGVDFKYKEISVIPCVIAGFLGIGFCIAEQRDVESVFLSLIPGIFSIIFSKITKEVIGYGDGIVFIVMALFLSLQQQVAILMTAFMIAGVVALIMLVFFRKKGNYRIPFIPFLFIAYLVECSVIWRI